MNTMKIIHIPKGNIVNRNNKVSNIDKLSLLIQSHV